MKILDIHKLFEGIYNIEKEHISRKYMIILLPTPIWENIIATYTLFIQFVSINTVKTPCEFMGIKVIDDISIQKIVIKSIISNHREEIELGTF